MIYWKLNDILVFLVLLEIAGDFHIDMYFICIYIIHNHTTSTTPHLHFFSLHWAITFGFAKSFVRVMSCHLQWNFLSYITKRDDIAAVDYLKVKNDVTHWKTIIFDSWQIHAAPSFLLLSSYIVSLRYNNLLRLHQATKGEEKNTLIYLKLSSFTLVIFGLRKLKLHGGLRTQTHLF